MRKINKDNYFYNENDDPTYDNWLALLACIVNEKLTISRAISKLELNLTNNTGE